MKKLSHINEENKPQMVDVSKKDESSRVACAQTVVVFPATYGKMLHRRHPVKPKKKSLKNSDFKCLKFFLIGW